MSGVANQEIPQKSGAAVASMVMGIISCTLIPLLLTIPAIVLGFIGLNKVKNEGLAGKGFAITGIITGFAGLIFGTIALIVFSTFASFFFEGVNQAGITASNAANAKMVLLGCRTYAIENDSRFPENLEELTPDYIDLPEICSFKTDEGGQKPFHYVSGLDSDSPPNTVIIYTDPNALNKRVVGFVGGHVETLSEEEFEVRLEGK